MPEIFDQTDAEKLLQQIEEGLTHSRDVIGQINIIRRLRFTIRGPIPLRPPVSLPALQGS
jgi:hypothetical protein